MLFSFSSLSAIRVVSSAYLRLLIFLLVIMISACASSSLAFHMMYSTCKLNKQGDNIQPWCTPFPIWNQSVVPLYVSNCCFLTCIEISQEASKVMLKILQARLQQYMNCKLPDVQAGFRKGRETRDQIANIRWIMEKAREFQKNIYFCFIDYARALTVWITINCGKFWKRWEYQTTSPASWETYM